jgi:hypothetical protein
MFTFLANGTDTAEFTQKPRTMSWYQEDEWIRMLDLSPTLFDGNKRTLLEGPLRLLADR